MSRPTDLIAAELGPWTPQRRFTALEVQRMLADGILKEDDPVELIGGLLISAEPQSVFHAGPIQALTQRFARELDPARWMVRVQLPFSVDEYSEPEPDLAVVPLGEAGRRESHPRRAALIVEVAQTSLSFDTSAKRSLYAAAAVPEYWVADVARRTVLVFQEPDPASGTYRRTREVGPDQRLAASAFPDVVLRVGELFVPEDEAG